MSKDTKIQLKTQKVPKLRFPGFSDAWEEKKIGDAVTFLRGRGISKDDISENGKNRCIRYGELYTDYNEMISVVKSKTNISESESLPSIKNDVLMPSSGETPLDIARSSCIKENNILLGGDLNVLRPKENQVGVFLAYYLSNFQKINIARISQGYSVVHLYASQLKNLKINLPIFSEQQKIAEFLGAVDEWIENLKTQKENFEKYKKGIMQKIFSHEIRFKDENEKDFPKWEEKKLGEIGEIYQPQTISQSDLSENGMYLVYGANGIIGKYQKYNHEKEQVIITCRGSTCGTINFTKPFSWITGNAMVVNTDENNEVNKVFIFYYLQNDSLSYLISGSGQPQITGSVKNHKMFLPSLAEQQKIAEFLTSLDKIIESKQQQIAKAEQWKKGLMQGLFV